MATAYIECDAPDAAHPGFVCAHPVTDEGDVLEDEDDEDYWYDDPDEDGQKALMRHLEGGWHGGMLHDESWWTQ